MVLDSGVVGAWVRIQGEEKHTPLLYFDRFVSSPPSSPPSHRVCGLKVCLLAHQERHHIQVTITRREDQGSGAILGAGEGEEGGGGNGKEMVLDSGVVNISKAITCFRSDVGSTPLNVSTPPPSPVASLARTRNSPPHTHTSLTHICVCFTLCDEDTHHT